MKRFIASVILGFMFVCIGMMAMPFIALGTVLQWLERDNG